MQARIKLVCPAFVVTLLAFGPVGAADFKEFSCHALPKDKTAEAGPEFSVLSLGKSGSLVVPLPPNKEKDMVMCFRSLLAVSPNDGKVIDAGFSLFVGTPDGRIAALAGSRPSLMLVAVQGDFTKAELKLLTKTLKVINGS